jgi:hypothetical protein
MPRIFEASPDFDLPVNNIFVFQLALLKLAVETTNSPADISPEIFCVFQF